MQQGLYDLEDAYNKVDIGILAQKLQAMDVSATVVLQEQKVTYLGTVLDQRITMSPDIETQKATKSIGLLRFAATQNVQQRSLLMLMKATGGSRLENGLHLSLCASQQSMRKLQQVQNQAMRVVTGAAKPTPCNTLRYWLGLNSVKTRQKAPSRTSLSESRHHKITFIV